MRRDSVARPEFHSSADGSTPSLVTWGRRCWVVPDGLPGDGRMDGTTGSVTQHAFCDGEVGSGWLHEDVHARQSFQTADGMGWLREASATSLRYRVLEEQVEGTTRPLSSTA